MQQYQLFKFKMAFQRLCIVLFVIHLFGCNEAQVSVGFANLEYRVQEDARKISIDVFKSGENQEEILVLVTPITYDNLKRSLPPEFNNIELPDPAEYELNGRYQDFIHNGPSKYVFGPSSETETGSIEVMINDDSINEADEGFFLYIEIEKQTADKIVLERDGIALVTIIDEDPIMIGFEQPQYEVQEGDGLIDNVIYLTKNGMESEQILRVLVKNPSGSATRGEDFDIDAVTEVNLHPEHRRRAFPIQLIDDQLPEESESLELHLSVEDDQPRLTLGLSRATVNIEDNDVVTVGFEEASYTVNESAGAAEVCVHIASPQEVDLTVFATVSTRDETAKDISDYSHIKQFVNLPTFDERNRLCYNIPLINDDEVEYDEMFTVLLETDISTPPNVLLQPDHVSVYVVDDDTVNECRLGEHNCHENAVCTDTHTGYTCTCKNGYAGDGFNCEDINECLDSSSNYCDEVATCTNTEGSFTCACPDGFSGNGMVCVIDTPPHECLHHRDCHVRASCQGRPQGNKCVCNTGYYGDGKHCTEINECTDGSHRCPREATCINTQGSYFCKCNRGYRPSGKYACNDYNECTTYHHNCDRNATCRNTIGSFTCTCNRGYSGDGTRGNCRATNSG